MCDRDKTPDEALREGLRGLPVPEVGADFAARVRADLARPAPWWRDAWRVARPLLAPAACSLAGSLVLLAWLSSTPPAVRPSAPGPAVSVAAGDDAVESASFGGMATLRRRVLLAAGAMPAPMPRPAALERHLRLPETRSGV